MTALHWPEVARRWAQVGPPLRPSAEDVALYEALVRDRFATNAGRRALILGVTPEIHGVLERAGAVTTAVDHTPAMIEAVWPGPQSAALCAEWTAMPLARASQDLSFCDGGLHLLEYPDGQRELARELGRVVAPGGLVVLRLFVPPERQERVADVLGALLVGQIGNLNLLKLRLATALQESPRSGVELASIFRTVQSLDRDLRSLASRLGWSVDHLLALESYRDSPVRYHFVDGKSAIESFCTPEAGFELVSLHVPGYELGERCPTLVLRRR